MFFLLVQVTVDQATTLTGTLTLGATVLVKPTLRIVAGASLAVNTLAIFSGSIIVEEGANFTISTAASVTAVLAASSTVTITGDLDVQNGGSLTITSGTLVLDGDSSLEEDTTVAQGATLQLDGNHALTAGGQISGNGDVVVGANGVVSLSSQGGTFTISAPFDNSGSVSVTNGAELV